MKKMIKYILVKILFYSGLPFIFRKLIQRNKLTILVLHDPDPVSASKHFTWLSRHYNIIGLEDYLSVAEGKNDTTVPGWPLIITLDDGHIGNYELLPVIKNTGVPVTIFLCSGIINTNRHYWFNFKGLPYPSDSLKVIPNESRLEILNQSGFDPQKEFPYPQAMTKEQILEMKEYVNFQGHTVFHPCLPQCHDEESWWEISESKKQLESEYGLEINTIAYPNGDFSEREIEFAKKAGYLCGVTVSHGYNRDKKENMYRLGRFSVKDNDTVEMLAIKASGIWSFLKNMSKKISPGSKKISPASGGK